jgi:reactive intermediate/imine deaminase
MNLRALSLAASLIACAMLAPHALVAQKQSVIPQGMAASATLTPGIRNGNTLYVSGQLGVSRDAPDSTIEGQTKKSLENIQKVVEAAGAHMSDVTKCTVFIVNLKDFGGMNSAYSQMFSKEPPARSTVVVAALVSPAAKIEIECIAAIPAK